MAPGRKGGSVAPLTPIHYNTSYPSRMASPSVRFLSALKTPGMLFAPGKLLLLLGFLFSLSGCFDFEEMIYLNPDGSGRAVIRYAVLPSLIAGSPFFRLPEGSIPLSREDVAKRLALKPGLIADRIDVYDLEGMRNVRIHLQFEHIRYLTDQGISYSYEPEGKYLVLKIKVARGARPGQVRQPELQKAIAQGMTNHGFRFKVFLPRKVEESNADKVEWSVASWFVPLGYFFDPTVSEDKILYAKIPLTFWERVKLWSKKLFK